MSMRGTAAGYVAALMTFLVLDAAWLLLVAIEMFQREIGSFMRPTPIFGAVIALYLIYALAMTLLAALPGAKNNAPAEAAWRGAVLGLGAYGLYDLTNHATLQNYSLNIALADMAWGTFVTSAACAAGCVAAMRLR